ncbi:MAG: DUF4340 domain-containing protein [Phormidesmis sp. RL_2_1]|nr:DUF4340 domain-containing protein [Phormidesmis sp. RL_2_1]
MLKRSTVLLVIGAIALGGGVLFFERQQTDNRQSGLEPTVTAAPNSAAEGEPLLPVAEQDITQLTLKRSGETLSFRKNEDGTWQMTEPNNTLAESGAVAFLLSQLTSPTVKTLQVDTANLADFGLAEPQITIDLVAQSKTYQLDIGGPDFTGDQLYVQSLENSTDPQESDAAPVNQAKIYVVSGGLGNAVERRTSGWIAAETPAEAAPAAETPADSTPSEGTASEGTASEGTASEGTASEAIPTDGTAN